MGAYESAPSNQKLCGGAFNPSTLHQDKTYLHSSLSVTFYERKAIQIHFISISYHLHYNLISTYKCSAPWVSIYETAIQNYKTAYSIIINIPHPKFPKFHLSNKEESWLFESQPSLRLGHLPYLPTLHSSSMVDAKAV